MSKSTKITKSDMTDAITLHFSKQGKRLTNLSKTTIPKLQEIINKHNINLEEMMLEINNKKEQYKKQREEEEEQHQKVFEEYKKQKQIKEKRIIYMYNKLKPKYKERVKQAQYDKFVEEAILNNKIAVNETDKMMESFKKKLSRVVRIDDNIISVNGVQIHNGHLTKIVSREEMETHWEKDDEKRIATCKNNEELIIKLYVKQIRKNPVTTKKLIIQEEEEDTLP